MANKFFTVLLFSFGVITLLGCSSKPTRETELLYWTADSNLQITPGSETNLSSQASDLNSSRG